MTTRRYPITAVAVSVLTIGAALMAVQRTNPEWPRIRAAEARQTFVDPTGDVDTPFRLLIGDIAGNAAYRLECHNVNYEETEGITFSGDFHCALFAVAGDKRLSGNLLTDGSGAQRRSDWLNRGRMRAAQLRGPCSGTPYGTTRVFRLRGLRITLRFSDFKWLNAEPNALLTQFTFDVSVTPDSSARTEYAEPVSGPKSVENACL